MSTLLFVDTELRYRYGAREEVVAREPIHDVHNATGVVA